MRRRRLVPGALLAAVFAVLGSAVPANAAEEILGAASYPDMTTYSCRTDAIPIYPGQNTNLFAHDQDLPQRARRSAARATPSVFAPGSTAEGYVTRFKPSMVELKPGGKLVTPSVWDLHLHHVVWLVAGRRPDVRLRRGEDDRRSCRRATGSRSAATRPGASTT